MYNPTTRRFIPKQYGRGFTPVTRQGRLCVVALAAVIMGSAYEHNLLIDQSPNYQDFVGFFVDIFVIILSSSWWLDKYTDGELKQRRGQKN